VPTSFIIGSSNGFRDGMSLESIRAYFDAGWKHGA